MWKLDAIIQESHKKKLTMYEMEVCAFDTIMAVSVQLLLEKQDVMLLFVL